MSQDPPVHTLVIDDTRYSTRFTHKFLHRKKYFAPDPRLFGAVIPGVIRGIHVKAGQQVKRGDELFILEAMKMKNLITSPRDGRIKIIHATLGAMVTKNEILLEFED